LNKYRVVAIAQRQSRIIRRKLPLPSEAIMEIILCSTRAVLKVLFELQNPGGKGAPFRSSVPLVEIEEQVRRRGAVNEEHGVGGDLILLKMGGYAQYDHGWTLTTAGKSRGKSLEWPIQIKVLETPALTV
jgi:hypothetical protein